ncbi:MAG: hypothetical protein DRN29_08250 [Thermoplasmata archaeon]|nr:MAG: hypothetical protein DRN29_08250 [Thermoplasmata archaeon]
MVLVSILLILALSISPAFDEIIISVDCNRVDGIIKPFAEINCGPLPIHYVKNGVDLTQQYKRIGINFIRTHDFYGPTDISTIFPNWNASVDNPSSYNFTSSDKVIGAIINTSCHVFYRLGESASENGSLRQPPANFSKWAEICKHIVMHYNDGWANGYYYNITYWEIWNEPDLKGFWNGTAEQYYKLYEITARTLKKYNPSLKVGGPCTSSIFNENFTIGFLKYVSENDVPLDFFSWHMYASHPSELYKASRYIRHILDEYGFNQCENILTEWNINILSPQRDKDNEKNAAFTALSLIAFQDANLNYAFRYRGTQDNNWLVRLLGFDLSLFTYDGKFKMPALSYLAMHYMMQTPLRIFLPYNISKGIACLAGISDDRSNVSLLVANYEGENKICKVDFKNLSWNKGILVHYVIDTSHHLEIVENKPLNSKNCSFSFMLEKNSVHFFRLTNSSFIPPEGPEVAKIPFLLRLRFLDPLLKLLGILLLMLIFSYCLMLTNCKIFKTFAFII